MRSKPYKYLSTFIGLCIIGVGILCVWLISQTGWHAFRSLSENVQIALAVAVLSLISTLGSIVYTKVKEKKLQIEAHNNQKKQQLYAKFTDDILKLLANPELGDDEDFTHEVRMNFMKNSILWADHGVLEAYHKFRTNYQNDGSDEQVMWDISTLFLEFRKDLGHSNKNINQHLLMEILYDQSNLKSFYTKFGSRK